MISVYFLNILQLKVIITCNYIIPKFLLKSMSWRIMDVDGCYTALQDESFSVVVAEGLNPPLIGHGAQNRV